MFKGGLLKGLEGSSAETLENHLQIKQGTKL
jgi:hypothetical protein